VQFIRYDRAAGIPNIVVDGAAAAQTVLTLSHWPKSAMPARFRADTSAEIVFNYGLLDERPLLDAVADHGETDERM
jgi:uncharacterized protein DUF6687